jgi:hypothetical protein
MAYEIFIQDFAPPVFSGIKEYFPDSNIVYSGLQEEIQENPDEFLQEKGMGRISTNKWEYEIVQEEAYHDTKEEKEYVTQEEEDEISIVSWQKAAERIFQEGDFQDAPKNLPDFISEDFF